MTHKEKVLQKLLGEGSESNVEFADLVNLLLSFGFQVRTRGDHHIFTKTGVEEIINLQPVGHHAKAYQVHQVRSILRKYRLGGI